jgi:hypothetical protein
MVRTTLSDKVAMRAALAPSATSFAANRVAILGVDSVRRG